MNDYLFSGILIVLSLLIGWALYLFASFLLKKTKIFFSQGIKANLSVLRNPLRYLIPVLCFRIIAPFLRLPDEIHGPTTHFFQIVLIGLFGWLATKLVVLIRDGLLKRHDLTARDNMRARSMHTQMRLAANIINVVIALLTISFMLMSFSEIRHIGVSILASAGIMGIVIGFAAQKTLGNLIAGVQIAIAQPIRLDDVVVIENEWGRIEEITLTFVVVRIWDLRRLVLPISYFLEKPFQNWTRTSADLLGTVFIYADYTLPVQEVRDELTRILEDNPLWDKKAQGLQVTNATDKTIELRALMSAADSPTAWNLRCEVREKLLAFLQQRFPKSLPQVRLNK